MPLLEPTTVCRACGSAELDTPYVVREQMYGTGEPFAYRRCRDCGSRSIVEVPDDLGRHYPADYYSFSAAPPSPLKVRLRATRDAGHAPGATLPSRLLAAVAPDATVAAVTAVAHDRETRVLDVGSGRGELLDKLAAIGFRDLTGIDPFLPVGAERSGPGLSVIRQSLEVLAQRAREGRGQERRFDLVMMHHVIEHHAAPASLLSAAADVLSIHGRVLVRTPLADSWAASHFGEHWVQHDAPRHVVVFTEEGLARCAARAGLRVTLKWRDSQAFQFWASEAYQRGESLTDVLAGRARSRLRRMILGSDRRAGARARALNARGIGDQGAFLLERAPV